MGLLLSQIPRKEGIGISLICHPEAKIGGRVKNESAVVAISACQPIPWLYDETVAEQMMLELIQFPWSPYCIVQRRLLEYSRAKFKIINVPNGDRSLVWKITRQRYYQVPVLRDGRKVLFETDENSQVVAKYLDQKLGLDLFPKRWEGVQDLLWRYFESEVEGVGFKLNDIYWEEMVPAKDRLLFLRHKERKFGRRCIQQWRQQQAELLKELERKLTPCEEMLLTRDFLLEDRPRFVDFDLFGMLGNFLYSGHYQIPRAHQKLRQWYKRMASLKVNQSAREKLYS